jgi:hypothetical protein
MFHTQGRKSPVYYSILSSLKISLLEIFISISSTNWTDGYAIEYDTAFGPIGKNQSENGKI